MQKITLAYSPCPNDTYIFGGLALGLIDLHHEYEITLNDVEALNVNAIEGRYDVSKLSYHAFAHLLDSYSMYDVGSALGYGVGPLLVKKANRDDSMCTIAIPGKYTTAHFLLKTYLTDEFTTKEMLFSDIEQSVLNEEVDAGVLIHENRFTYEDKGLELIQDLGSHWEDKYNLPIPLGGIACKSSLDNKVKSQIYEDMCNSLKFARQNYDSIKDYVEQHAQEMSEEVRQKHINLYVNESTEQLKAIDKKAINIMLDILTNRKNADDQWLYTGL